MARAVYARVPVVVARATPSTRASRVWVGSRMSPSLVFLPWAPGAAVPCEFTNPYYDFQDSVSYLAGKHSFKFGVEYTHIEADYQPPRHAGPDRFPLGWAGFTTATSSANSTAFEDFFAGTPTRGSQLVGTTARNLAWKNLAGFVQDDWRVTPKLMLNWACATPTYRRSERTTTSWATSIRRWDGSAGSTVGWRYSLEARLQRLLAPRGFCLGCHGQGHDCDSGRGQYHLLDVHPGPVHAVAVPELQERHLRRRPDRRLHSGRSSRRQTHVSWRDNRLAAPISSSARLLYPAQRQLERRCFSGRRRGQLHCHSTSAT